MSFRQRKNKIHKWYVPKTNIATHREPTTWKLKNWVARLAVKAFKDGIVHSNIS